MGEKHKIKTKLTYFTLQKMFVLTMILLEKNLMDKISVCDECTCANSAFIIHTSFTCKDFSGFNSMKSIILGRNGIMYATHFWHF